jgi:alkylhydroperoxidase/carboxymuconolactone decarboxylase family protein YurZ
MHLKKTKEKGFTQDEIGKAAWMGTSFAGSSALLSKEKHGKINLPMTQAY